MKRVLSVLGGAALALTAAPVTHQITWPAERGTLPAYGPHFAGPYTLTRGNQAVPVLYIETESAADDEPPSALSEASGDLMDNELEQLQGEDYSYTLLIPPASENEAWGFHPGEIRPGFGWSSRPQKKHNSSGFSDSEIKSGQPGTSAARNDSLAENSAPEPPFTLFMAGLFALALAICRRKRK